MHMKLRSEQLTIRLARNVLLYKELFFCGLCPVSACQCEDWPTEYCLTFEDGGFIYSVLPELKEARLSSVVLGEDKSG